MRVGESSGCTKGERREGGSLFKGNAQESRMYRLRAAASYWNGAGIGARGDSVGQEGGRVVRGDGLGTEGDEVGVAGRGEGLDGLGGGGPVRNEPSAAAPVDCHGAERSCVAVGGRRRRHTDASVPHAKRGTWGH